MVDSLNFDYTVSKIKSSSTTIQLSATSSTLCYEHQNEKAHTEYIKGILKEASVLLQDQYKGKQEQLSFSEHKKVLHQKRLRFADDCGESLVEVYEVAKIQYYTWWDILVADDDAFCVIC